MGFLHLGVCEESELPVELAPITLTAALHKTTVHFLQLIRYAYSTSASHFSRETEREGEEERKRERERGGDREREREITEI